MSPALGQWSQLCDLALLLPVILAACLDLSELLFPHLLSTALDFSEDQRKGCFMTIRVMVSFSAFTVIYAQ